LVHFLFLCVALLRGASPHIENFAARFTVNDFTVTVEPSAGNTLTRRLICE